MTQRARFEMIEFRALMPARYRIVLGLVGIATVVTLLIPAVAGDTWAFFVAVPTAALFLGISLMRTRVQLTEDRMRIRVAGIFSTEFPYHQISKVTVGPTTGLLQGMGLRILPSGGGTGYLVGGPSVRIEAGTTLLVSSSEPKRLCAEIERRRTSAS